MEQKESLNLFFPDQEPIGNNKNVYEFPRLYNNKYVHIRRATNYQEVSKTHFIDKLYFNIPDIRHITPIIQTLLHLPALQYF